MALLLQILVTYLWTPHSARSQHPRHCWKSAVYFFSSFRLFSYCAYMLLWEYISGDFFSLYKHLRPYIKHIFLLNRIIEEYRL